MSGERVHWGDFLCCELSGRLVCILSGEAKDLICAENKLCNWFLQVIAEMHLLDTVGKISLLLVMHLFWESLHNHRLMFRAISLP